MEIVIVFLLIVLNGLFSMSELAVVSANKGRLQQAAEKGDHRARGALELNENPTRFLSTVQIGITLIGILAGAYGEKSLSVKLSGWLKQFSAVAPYEDTLALIIVVGSLTYFSLVIGELIPKRLAMISPERIASFVAAPMRGLSALVSPVVALLTVSTEGFLKLIGLGQSKEPTVTEADVKMLIQQGTEEGVFNPVEQDMMERVIRLGDRPITALMTPRPAVIWLDANASSDEIARRIAESTHSRYPVCRGSLDHVEGIVQTRSIAARALAGQPLNLLAEVQSPLIVPQSLSMLEVLERFKETRQHIALVMDEFGSIKGMVTLNDVLEAIVGELPAHDEPDDPEIVQRDDGSWLLDAMLPIDEFAELLHIEALPENERGNYQTLSGFVMARLGHMPVLGEHFTWRYWRFEVMDMDKHRLDKILVAPIPQSVPAAQITISSGIAPLR